MSNRGYFGIGVYSMKNVINYGTLYRSASCFDAAFIFLVGKRFKKQSSDTTDTYKHIPLLEFQTAEDFLSHRPYDCRLIGVEICENSKDIYNFVHPERAMYILGAEDIGLPKQILDKCSYVVQIPTNRCLNVAVAGSIVMYDRILKEEDKCKQNKMSNQN